VAFKLEGVERLLRLLLLPSHHRAISRIDRCAMIESRDQQAFNRTSSTVSLTSANTAPRSQNANLSQVL
jgi:hypothetical protein